MPTSKSSSVLSSPNPRSSEISNPMRRSFTGNPFSKPSVIANPRINFPSTPANSPSDFPRRSSVGIRDGVGSLRDSMDDKENGKDQILKPAKVRSPAACSKATKNFMSPTISASCKVNESPRKKVLVERNEAAPCFADPKSHVRKVTFAEPLEERKLDPFFDDGIIPNFEEGPRSSLTSEDSSGESETSVCYMNVPLVPKNDSDLSFETVHDIMNMNVPLVLENDIHTEPSFETFAKEPDCVNLDPTFKLSPTATPPVSLKATVVAPLDADPLLPPYDPKTNYLSPRPQFLHYKPKPRMELLSERELEDSLISGSFSDTEVTEDAQSDGSQKESEDVSSNEMSKEVEGQVYEPSPERRTLVPEKTVEVPKPRFTGRTKAMALILLLAVAFVSISVSDSPVIDHTMFEDFYKVYESSELPELARANFDRFSQFAKTNFDGLAQNLHIWFTKSLCSISEFISDVRGVHSLAKLHYYNLTVQYDYPIFGHGENEIGETQAPLWNAQESEAALELGTDEDTEDISAEHYEVYEEQLQQDIEIITEVGGPESEEVLERNLVTMIEPEQALQLAEAGNIEAKLIQEVGANLNVETSQPSLNSEVAEFSIEASGNIDTKQAQENNAEFIDMALDSEVAKIDTATNNDEESGSIDAAIRGNEQRLDAIEIPPHMLLYLLLCAGTILIAGAMFNWSRKGTSSKNNTITGSVEQPVLHNNSFPSSQNKQISPDKPIRKMDVPEDSCPSETSSSYNKKAVKQLNEAHSIEKKRKSNYRRESLASSSSEFSMGLSYGSLTVYEKIPSKQGQGDEETTMITPVRRSSRIRKLATSPS
ncbi:hypothetical protein RJT34_32082 [Clitoria ternatea]|uniref:Uncharacterized protein n=1 Tax=Clitoria ternatea TaxID=43366 RepID=A0AAN9I1Y4_CLITE